MSEAADHSAAASSPSSKLPDAFWHGVREAPWRYDLFQLLRRIDAQGGERYPLGRAPLPKFEPLRIGQQPSMSFAPSTLAQRAAARRGRALMTSPFSASACLARTVRCRST